MIDTVLNFSILTAARTKPLFDPFVDYIELLQFDLSHQIDDNLKEKEKL